MEELLAQAGSTTDPGSSTGGATDPGIGTTPTSTATPSPTPAQSQTVVAEPVPEPLPQPIITQTPQEMAYEAQALPKSSFYLLPYLPIILGILAVGLGSYILARINKNKKIEEKEEDKKCLNFKKLMEEKLNELTDLKSTLGDYAKSTTVAEIKKKVKNKDATKVLAMAEKAEKEYERLKKLYEDCIALPTRTINKVAWVVIKNRKVLFARAKGKNIFYIPGGRVETGESEKQALVREMKEELDIDLKPDTIEYLETFRDHAHGEPAGVYVEVKCYTSAFTGIPKPSGEIEEIAAFSSVDRNKSASIGQMILDWLKHENLID